MQVSLFVLQGLKCNKSEGDAWKTFKQHEYLLTRLPYADLGGEENCGHGGVWQGEAKTAEDKFWQRNHAIAKVATYANSSYAKMIPKLHQKLPKLTWIFNLTLGNRRAYVTYSMRRQYLLQSSFWCWVDCHFSPKLGQTEVTRGT